MFGECLSSAGGNFVKLARQWGFRVASDQVRQGHIHLLAWHLHARVALTCQGCVVIDWDLSLRSGACAAAKRLSTTARTCTSIDQCIHKFFYNCPQFVAAIKGAC